MDNLESTVKKIAEVTISIGNKTKTKKWRVCKIKARSIIFMEIDKANRKNTFYKFDKKTLETFLDNETKPLFIFKNGVIPTRWESSWDSINSNPTPVYSHYPKYRKSRFYGR